MKILSKLKSKNTDQLVYFMFTCRLIDTDDTPWRFTTLYAIWVLDFLKVIYSSYPANVLPSSAVTKHPIYSLSLSNSAYSQNRDPSSSQTAVPFSSRFFPAAGFTNTVISLFYSNASSISSQAIANFSLPRFHGKWARFAFRVSTDNVTLFFNCNEVQSVTVKREPAGLQFDSASTLYIAQAGPNLREPFEVSAPCMFKCRHNIFIRRSGSYLHPAVGGHVIRVWCKWGV